MTHEGDLSLLGNLKRADKRIGLLAMSGGARGIVGGAHMTAFNDEKLQDNATVLFGISVGAWQMLYGACGRAVVGNSIIREECCTSAYMSRSLPRLVQGTTVDVGLVAATARSGPKKVNLDEVYACPADIWMGVTDDETSRWEMVDAKTAQPDPIGVAHASSAMVVVYRQPVYVNSRRKIDGVSNPLPAREVIEKWNLDGLIVFPNRKESLKPWLGRDVLEEVTMHLLPRRHRANGRGRHAKLNESLDYLREGKTPYLIMWPEIELHMFERCPDVLRAAELFEYQRMKELLKRAV